MTSYPTDITEKSWQMIISYIEHIERKCKYSIREIFNAIFYVVKTGYQWRMFTGVFAPLPLQKVEE